MTDLVVDAALLRDITTRLAPVPQAVTLGDWIAVPLPDALGCSAVADALHTAGVQQSARASITAQSVQRVRETPADVANTFASTDHALARRTQ